MATTVNSLRSDTSLIAAGEAVALPTDETNAAWIKLLPAGSFTCRDGRGPFHAGDNTALQNILSQTETLLATTEMMVDYDCRHRKRQAFPGPEGLGPGTLPGRPGQVRGFHRFGPDPHRPAAGRKAKRHWRSGFG
ncbi:MAG: hypothetical protein ABJQ71_14630 [Roseibium sp.]